MKNRIHEWIGAANTIVEEYTTKEVADQKKFLSTAREFPTRLRKIGILNTYLFYYKDKDKSNIAQKMEKVLFEQIRIVVPNTDNRVNAIITDFGDDQKIDIHLYYHLLEELLGFSRELKLYAEARLKTK